jgi:hypothetical protein
MTFSFNGSGTVTISGTVSIDSTLRTVKVAAGNNEGSSPTTIGTVPANKQWRIIAGSLTVAFGGAGTRTASIAAAGNTILNAVACSGAATSEGNNTSNFKLDYNNAIVLNAGETIVASNYAFAASIYYVELTV